MTPAQKVTLDAKHALQRLEQLTAWIDRNRPLVADNDAALRETLKSLEVGVSEVQQAVETPPAIGIVAEQPAARAQLAAALMLQPASPEDERKDIDDAEIVRRLLVRADELETCAAIRFRVSEAVMTPRDHPFKVSLLDMGDLTAIMVRVADQLGRGRGRPLRQAVERMTSVYEDVARKVQPSLVAGMSERDVHALRSLLDALYPSSERLKFLAAAGYWSDLAEVVAHITDTDRIRVLSLLWDEREDITALLRQLIDTRAQLGYAAEAFCPRDALLDRDAHSGWFIHHPRSIIAAATLHDLGSGHDASVRMVGRYGHTAVLSRPAIAAVVGELTLFTSAGLTSAGGAGAHAGLRQADVVDLPALAMPMDLTGDASSESRRAGLPGGLLARVYASAKALHLLDRACHRDELTSLVACCIADADNDDLLATSISDWIDLVQGDEPHVREQSRTGLFVVAASQDGRGMAMRQAAGRSSGTDVCEALAGADEWLAEWTPGRSFANVFAWNLEMRGIGVLPLARGSRRDLVATGIATGARGPAFTTEFGRLDVQRLVDGVALVSQASGKQRQLRRRLGQLNRDTRARFLRYRADSELVEASDWRQRVAASIEHRLARAARRGTLGRLIAALMIGEAELVAIYRRCDRSGLNERLRQAASAVIDLEADYGVMEPASERIVPRGRSITMAEAAVGHWLSAIRRGARSQRLCRQLGVAYGLFAHIADEIGAGAVRLGLVRRVAEVIEVSVVRERGGEQAFTAVVGAVINGFVERLTLETREAEPFAAVPGATAAMQPVGAEPAHQPRDLAGMWCAAFSDLVETNIANSRFWSAGEASTDLARILAQFPANNLEVE